MSLPDERVAPVRKLVEEKVHYLPIYIYTAIFGAIFVLGPFLARRGPNQGITRCCIMMSAFCCWIFWTTTYIVQMNPLLGPRLDNKTLAWIGHKWGLDPAKIPNPEKQFRNDMMGNYLRNGSDSWNSSDSRNSSNLSNTTLLRTELRQGLDAEPALDAVDPLAEPNVLKPQVEPKVPEPLAEPNVPNPQVERKVEPLADETKPKDPPEDPTQEKSQAEDTSRRRFNGTKLFTNLTHLIPSISSPQFGKVAN